MQSASRTLRIAAASRSETSGKTRAGGILPASRVAIWTCSNEVNGGGSSLSSVDGVAWRRGGFCALEVNNESANGISSSDCLLEVDGHRAAEGLFEERLDKPRRTGAQHRREPQQPFADERAAALRTDRDDRALLSLPCAAPRDVPVQQLKQLSKIVGLLSERLCLSKAAVVSRTRLPAGFQQSALRVRVEAHTELKQKALYPSTQQIYLGVAEKHLPSVIRLQREEPRRLCPLWLRQYSTWTSPRPRRLARNANRDNKHVMLKRPARIEFFPDWLSPELLSDISLFGLRSYRVRGRRRL